MNRSELLAIARGDRPADLVLRNARLVNVFSGTIEETDIALADGLVVGLGPGYSGEREEDLAGAYVGCFEMGFTFVLWLTAMKLVSATAKVANLIFLSPFLSLIFIRVVLGERIAPATVVGLVLIVGGLWWQGRREREPA